MTFDDQYDATIEPLKGVLPPSVLSHAITLLNYNSKNGKHVRQKMMKTFYDEICGGAGDDDARLYTIGWILEIWHSFLLVEDDIIDNAGLRRNQPTWCSIVGDTNALNDGLMLQSIANYLLCAHLSYDPQLLSKCMHTLCTVQILTCSGQHLDMREYDIEKMTTNDVKMIAKHKTALYTFWLPVKMAMNVYESTKNYKFDDRTIEQFQDVCVDLGILYQIVDDYEDIYGSHLKTPRDVEAKKCSWMIVSAFFYADKTQKDVLRTWYGQEDGREHVKKVFDHVDVRGKFALLTRDMSRQIHEKIKRLPFGRTTFVECMHKIMP